jgi:hypothetical protein
MYNDQVIREAMILLQGKINLSVLNNYVILVYMKIIVKTWLKKYFFQTLLELYSVVIIKYL